MQLGGFSRSEKQYFIADLLKSFYEYSNAENNQRNDISPGL